MPFRAARSTRSGRPGAQNDADIFDGLPVRQWRRQEQTIGIVEEEQPSSESLQAQGPTARDVSPEPPMPKGSEFYTPWCRELLRLARSGKLPQKTNKVQTGETESKKANSDKENPGHPSSDDKEVDAGFGPRGTKRGAEQGFPALRWGVVPRAMEEPERERLAKRRKGLPPLHATVHLDANVPMRKTKVKRTDAEGQSTVFEVMVPEGQTVEGEIEEQVTLENAGAAIAAPKPGTFVEGLGVTNEQGVVIASEGIAPLRRKGPVAFRKKKKKGPGRWQQKLSDMTTGGVSASAEALEERKRREQEAVNKAEGKAEEDHEAHRDAEEDDDGESEDDNEEGDDDDDREEGELSPDDKQDGDGDEPMLLDVELPQQSDVPSEIPTIQQDAPQPSPSIIATTSEVDATIHKIPPIPGLRGGGGSEPSVTDAAKDVHDEPAPDRNVPSELETSTIARPGTPSEKKIVKELSNHTSALVGDVVSPAILGTPVSHANPMEVINPLPVGLVNSRQYAPSPEPGPVLPLLKEIGPVLDLTRWTQAVVPDTANFPSAELMDDADPDAPANTIHSSTNTGGHHARADQQYQDGDRPSRVLSPRGVPPRELPPRELSHLQHSGQSELDSGEQDHHMSTSASTVQRRRSSGSSQRSPGSNQRSGGGSGIPGRGGNSPPRPDKGTHLHLEDEHMADVSGSGEVLSGGYGLHGDHRDDSNNHAIDDHAFDTDSRRRRQDDAIAMIDNVHPGDSTEVPRPNTLLAPSIVSEQDDNLPASTVLAVDETVAEAPPIPQNDESSTNTNININNKNIDTPISTAEPNSPTTIPETTEAHTSPLSTAPVDSSQSPQRPETEALTPEPDDIPHDTGGVDVHFEDGDVDLLGSVAEAEGVGYS